MHDANFITRLPKGTLKPDVVDNAGINQAQTDE
jgi:hypothetical protein